MDFLNFRDVWILPTCSIGRLYEDLINIVGQGFWYDTFKVQNIKWIWFVNDIVMTMNSDKVMCGSLAVYLSYAAPILNSVKEIHFYVPCSEKLNYANYFEKYIAVKQRIVTFRLHTGDCFRLSSCSDTVALSLQKDDFQNDHSK